MPRALHRILPLLLFVAAPGGSERVAAAQVVVEPAPPPFPNPKKFARGFFATGELGALVFLGRTGRYAGPGPNFGVRLGYDLFRWLAVQGHVSGTTSDATLPPPVVGQSFQTYVYDGEVRLALQLRRVQLFAEGGAGMAQISSNVLENVQVTSGSLFSLAILAGAGIDYHTLNRHFSLGLGADYLYLQGFNNTSALTITAYVKYTH